MFLNRHAVAQHAFVPLAVAGGHQAELPQHGSGMAQNTRTLDTVCQVPGYVLLLIVPVIDASLLALHHQF